MAQILRDRCPAQKWPEHHAEGCYDEKYPLPGNPLEQHGLHRHLPPAVTMSPVADGANRIACHSARQKLVDQRSEIIVAYRFPDAQVLAKPRCREPPAERREYDLHLHEDEAGGYIGRIGRRQACGNPLRIEAQDHGNEKCEGRR
jgi:hypothetical protein